MFVKEGKKVSEKDRHPIMLAIINMDDSATTRNDAAAHDHHLRFLLRDHYWIEMTAQVETCSSASLPGLGQNSIFPSILLGLDSSRTFNALSIYQPTIAVLLKYID